MTLIYFALLLGGLIFFHEFGHFIVARWMGVHVTTFSIGFGPKLFSIKGRKRHEHLPPTEYVIAALPLGGYVKMLGDDPAEEIASEIGDVAFNRKPIWRRLLIVSAGPAFNLILPFIIYFFLLLSTTQLLPSTVGTVVHDGPAWNAGVRPGDRIVEIDGEKVDYWWQVLELISERPAEQFGIRVQRGDEVVSMDVTTKRTKVTRSKELGVVEERGRIGIGPTYVKSIITVKPGSVAATAGLRNWDRVVGIDGKPVDRLDEVLRLLSTAKDRPVEIALVRYGPVQTDRFISLGLGAGMTITLPPAPSDGTRGVLSAEFTVQHVVRGSPAAKMGLAPGDRILTLDGLTYPTWGYIRDALRQGTSKTPFKLAWVRPNGERAEATFRLAEVPAPERLQPERKIALFGASVFSAQGQPQLIENDAVLGYALHHCVGKTVDAIELTFAGACKLTGVTAASFQAPATRRRRRGSADWAPAAAGASSTSSASASTSPSRSSSSLTSASGASPGTRDTRHRLGVT